MRAHPAVRSMPVLALFLALLLSAATAVSAQTADARYPGDTWMRYNLVEDAGFDAGRLVAGLRMEGEGN